MLLCILTRSRLVFYTFRWYLKYHARINYGWLRPPPVLYTEVVLLYSYSVYTMRLALVRFTLVVRLTHHRNHEPSVGLVVVVLSSTMM